MYTVYRDAVRKAPGNVRAHFNLGVAFLARQEWKNAAGEFSRAAELCPGYKWDEVARNLAFCHERLGDDLNAKKYYLKILVVRPDQDALKGYAGILYREGDIAGATEMLEKSVADMPDAVAFNNLGTLYARQKKHEKAFRCFTSATNLRPDYVDAWFNLIQAYESSGNKAMARKQLERMAELYSRNGWYPDAGAMARGHR
jgi:tetratricopeptide (TPR) repeat protein